MAAGQLIYCGSSNPNAMPKDYEEYEHVRRYVFPLPGWTHHYDATSASPEKVPNGLPYGLMIIDDVHWEHLDAHDEGGKHFSTRVESGTGRAMDLASRHEQWGVKYIAGMNPTDEDIASCQERRKNFLLERKDEIESNYQNGMKGQKGYSFKINANEKAIFAELGLVAPNAVATTGQTVEPETKPCPFCAEPIRVAALKCRFCQSDLTAPAMDEKRGPGRPRKEDHVLA